MACTGESFLVSTSSAHLMSVCSDVMFLPGGGGGPMCCSFWKKCTTHAWHKYEHCCARGRGTMPNEFAQQAPTRAEKLAAPMPTSKCTLCGKTAAALQDQMTPQLMAHEAGPHVLTPWLYVARLFEICQAYNMNCSSDLSFEDPAIHELDTIECTLYKMQIYPAPQFRQENRR